MATAQTLTAAIDLPDASFDRRTQFVLNGAPFETLLGQPPTDPLVLLLARGPAGYRFMVKALQHALTDARVERGDLRMAAAGPVEIAEAVLDEPDLDQLRAARIRP